MSDLDILDLLEDEYINNSKYLKLKQELEETRAEEQAQVINVIKRLIEGFEIDPSMFCKQGRKSKVAPKYRHKETGKTWTGRGRRPVDFPENWVEI
ncbi:H-NS histone family protein [Galenea microaerophila]